MTRDNSQPARTAEYNNIYAAAKAQKPRIIVCTIAFNLPEEVRKTTENIYAQNKAYEFIHVIANPMPGFPVDHWNDLPKSVKEAQENNARELKVIAEQYDSYYCEINNVGVSQNWTQIYKYFNMQGDDILILADPDEKTLTNGWIKALADVMNADKSLAWCSLLMHEQQGLMNDMGNYPKDLIDISGYRVYKMWPGTAINWGMGAIRASFIEKCGGEVPYGPAIYGGIETACILKIDEFKMRWATLADYYEEHQPCPELYGAWKQEMAFTVDQIPFEQWVRNKIII